MNLVDIKEQALSALRLPELKEIASKFEILPVGDLRVKQTWIDAIKLAVQTAKDAAKKLAKEAAQVAAECVKEYVTYDNAVVLANTVNVWGRRTLQFLWALTLVCVALVCIAIDLWRNREEEKEFLVKVYRRQLLRVRDRWVVWREMGEAALQANIVEPVVDKRDRINAMARAAKS